MKNIFKKYTVPFAICTAMIVTLVSSCAKDDYYIDGGKSNPVFNGTVLQYLQSNDKFDTIAQIVKLAGLEDVFNKEDITFFAPTDEVVRRTIGLVNSNVPNMGNRLNQELYNQNKDTIKVLSDVPTEIWRRYLLKYVFKGKLRLKDYPQLDFDLRALFPGAYYQGYNGDLANIGVVYNEVNGVKYTGYRQLSFSTLPDPSNPQQLNSAAVATSDIQPTNGVVHVLAVFYGPEKIGAVFHQEAANRFGLGYDFARDVVLSK